MKSINHIKTSIANIILFLLLLQSISLGQVDDWHRNPTIQYHDSLVVVNNDSLWVICGKNPELNISFLSQDLFKEIQHLKEYSKIRKYDLYQQFHHAYLGRLQNTSDWQSINEPVLGIYFRCPSDIRPIFNTENHFIEFSQLSDSSLCLRVSITSESFIKEAVSRGWNPKYSDQWFAFKNGSDDDYYRFLDVAYIEGVDWNCLRAIEPNIVHHEDTGTAYGDKLKLFAMKKKNKDTSLILEITCANPEILEEEIYTMLSSIRFKK